jgi:hypothetical protein
MQYTGNSTVYCTQIAEDSEQCTVYSEQPNVETFLWLLCTPLFFFVGHVFPLQLNMLYVFWRPLRGIVASDSLSAAPGVLFLLFGVDAGIIHLIVPFHLLQIAPMRSQIHPSRWLGMAGAPLGERRSAPEPLGFARQTAGCGRPPRFCGGACHRVVPKQTDSMLRNSVSGP